ncbi:MAG: hypothetical protein RJB39_794 [Candidatus Parcubacteria bacterium]
MPHSGRLSSNIAKTLLPLALRSVLSLTRGPACFLCRRQVYAHIDEYCDQEYKINVPNACHDDLRAVRKPQPPYDYEKIADRDRRSPYGSLLSRSESCARTAVSRHLARESPRGKLSQLHVLQRPGLGSGAVDNHPYCLALTPQKPASVSARPPACRNRPGFIFIPISQRHRPTPSLLYTCPHRSHPTNEYFYFS